MFAADLDGAWTRDWIAWRGLGPLLDGTIRALAPAARAGSSLTISAGERVGSHAQLTMALEARDRDGEPGQRALAHRGGPFSDRPPRRLPADPGELWTVRRSRARGCDRTAVLLGRWGHRRRRLAHSRRGSVRRAAFRCARRVAAVGDRPNHRRHVPARRRGPESRPAHRRRLAATRWPRGCSPSHCCSGLPTSCCVAFSAERGSRGHPARR